MNFLRCGYKAFKCESIEIFPVNQHAVSVEQGEAKGMLGEWRAWEEKQEKLNSVSLEAGLPRRRVISVIKNKKDTSASNHE